MFQRCVLDSLKIDYMGSRVVQVKSDLQPPLMPTTVHEQEVAEVSIFIFGGILGWIVLLEQLRGVHELPQVQTLCDLNNLIEAKIVWRKGPEFGPPVIELEYSLSLVIHINGDSLSPDEEKAFQIIPEGSLLLAGGLLGPDACHLHCLSHDFLSGRPQRIGIRPPESGQLAGFTAVSELPEPLERRRSRAPRSETK